MSDMDLEAFKFAISQPGALTAALNYYRNVVTLYLEDDWLKDGQALITSPTLIIWVTIWILIIMSQTILCLDTAFCDKVYFEIQLVVTLDPHPKLR
jgi:hypothetical protein